MAEEATSTMTTAEQESTQQGQQSSQQVEKTFTQAEVNQISSREKKQGRAAIMRELGLDPEDKDAIKRVKGILDSQKTTEQKAADDLKAATAAQQAAEQRATAAENKLKILSGGCRPEYVDDVSTLVSARMSEDTDFDAALAATKKKFPSLFGKDGDTGTGHGTGHKKTPENTVGSLGKRLAQAQTQTIKNPYFND